MSKSEMDEIRTRCKAHSGDGRFEHYKMSLQYDNPEARMAHGFPIDSEEKEVKQMLQEAKNTGRSYPE